jgi:hypothetical protein
MLRMLGWLSITTMEGPVFLEV